MPIAGAGDRALSRQQGVRSRIQRELGGDDVEGDGAEYGRAARSPTAPCRWAPSLNGYRYDALTPRYSSYRTEMVAGGLTCETSVSTTGTLSRE